VVADKTFVLFLCVQTRVSFYTSFINSAVTGSIPPTASWATVVIPNVILLILAALL
jgi:hypothetical protein